LMASILSQFPPSESTKLRQLSYEPTFYKFLRYDCNQPAVRAVAFLEACSSYYYCVIQLAKSNPAQVWQALAATMGYDSGTPKIVVAVDEDIDPRDAEAINWAIASRCQPHRDVRIWTGRTAVMDLSAVPPAVAELGTEALYPPPQGCSALLIDATRKWPYPPVSLPRREYMERARALWEELGLPPLQPKAPWYGYELGYWPADWAQAAEWAVRGEYRRTGEWQATRRRSPE